MKPEDMRVYQVAREFGKEVDKILVVLPPSAKKIADHLERAAESAGLNLMEGLIAFKPKVKASYLDISRRETGEARKAMQRLIDKRSIEPLLTKAADQLANVLIAMLTVMIKQQEKRMEDGE